MKAGALFQGAFFGGQMLSCPACRADAGRVIEAEYDGDRCTLFAVRLLCGAEVTLRPGEPITVSGACDGRGRRRRDDAYDDVAVEEATR